MDKVSIKKISKKKAKAIVYDKFANALSEFKSGINPKKFETKLKKASKLFAADIAKVGVKSKGRKKKKTKTAKAKAVPAIQAKEVIS
jgi:hypothetical protein